MPYSFKATSNEFSQDKIIYLIKTNGASIPQKITFAGTTDFQGLVTAIEAFIMQKHYKLLEMLRKIVF